MVASDHVEDLPISNPPKLPDFEEYPLFCRTYYSDGEHHLLYLNYGDEAIIVGNFMDHPGIYTPEFSYECSDSHNYWPRQYDPDVSRSLIIAIYSRYSCDRNRMII